MNIKITIHINIGNSMSSDPCIINNISINIIICIEIIINISILISINILNFKISKYFNTSSTYDGLVNAHNSAFTNIHTRPHICECRNICIHKSTYCGHMCECRYFCIHIRPNICECRNICICESQYFGHICDCRYICIQKVGIFANADISAFTNMTEVLRCVNADISAFTNIWPNVNAEISVFTNLNTSVIFVNAEFSVFTSILILSRFVNADISAFSALTRYEFNEIILSKLHYTCIFNRLDFNGYYDAYDSTFYGRLFLIYLG